MRIVPLRDMPYRAPYGQGEELIGAIEASALDQSPNAPRTRFSVAHSILIGIATGVGINLVLRMVDSVFDKRR